MHIYTFSNYPQKQAPGSFVNQSVRPSSRHDLDKRRGEEICAAQHIDICNCNINIEDSDKTRIAT